MQPFSSRPARRFLLFPAIAVLATGSLLAGCDRHSADDLPESYGHGSSHKKAYDRHETDSRVGSRHFSDSKGVSPDDVREKASAPEPTATPGGTAAGQLFPSPVGN